MPQRCSVSFAEFAFDPASGELTRDGRNVRLQRQPSRLLELLLARPGEVVTRDEIRQALWGADTHVDFERSLNFCVARLRAALRDDAASPRFVETIPTRGYRFIGAPTFALRASVGKPAAVPRALVGTASSRAVLIAAVLVAGAAVIAGALLSFSYTASRVPKIVVVPFHNETSDAAFDRVAKGVSDAAVARLATPDRLSRLLVIGNAADLRFSFKPRDMRAIGESLDARFLLLGQLKKDDRRLRIVAHLIRVSDQTHLWAKTYDTDTLDLPQQASIAEAIAGSVADTIASAAHSSR